LFTEVAPSLDHLVSQGKWTGWHADTERFGSPKVNDVFEFGGLQDRKVGWLFAVENAAGVHANLAISILNACPIAYQTTRGSRGA
jgi:hypothetical protein